MKALAHNNITMVHGNQAQDDNASAAVQQRSTKYIRDMMFLYLFNMARIKYGLFHFISFRFQLFSL